MAPPIMPAGARRATSLQLMLRCQIWEAPEDTVVKISVTCVTALAVAGGTPKASMAVVEMTPNAMPCAPSTICAQKPMMMKTTMSVIGYSWTKAARLSGPCFGLAALYRPCRWAICAGACVERRQVSERSLYQGRQCRDGGGNAVARSPDLG